MYLEIKVFFSPLVIQFKELLVLEILITSLRIHDPGETYYEALFVQSTH